MQIYGISGRLLRDGSVYLQEQPPDSSPVVAQLQTASCPTTDDELPNYTRRVAQLQMASCPTTRDELANQKRSSGQLPVFIRPIRCRYLPDYEPVLARLTYTSPPLSYLRQPGYPPILLIYQRKPHKYRQVVAISSLIPHPIISPERLHSTELQVFFQQKCWRKHTCTFLGSGQ